jgi:hypothetical protein
MLEEQAKERIAHIGQGLDAIKSGWPFLLSEINERIASLTEQLINNDNEQTRGRIKALLEIKELPESLQSEREGIGAALSEMDAAS